jgi:hypothetical protein
MLIYCVDRPQQDRRLVLKATAVPYPAIQIAARPGRLLRDEESTRMRSGSCRARNLNSSSITVLFPHRLQRARSMRRLTFRWLSAWMASRRNRRPPCKMLFSRADVERAKAIFVAVFTWLSGYQYERGIRKLLPDNEILGRNGEPTESEHVPAGLCYLPGLGPCDLGNHFPFAFSPRRTMPHGSS